MATQVERLRIITEFTDTAARRIVGLQNKLTKGSTDSLVIAKATQRENLVNLNILKRQVGEAGRFKFEYLGILFGAMAVQRATVGFLRSAITSYNAAFEKTSAFQRETNKLAAAWEFLKFRLVDTLTKTEAFRNFVEFAVKIVDAIAGMDDETLAAIAVALFVIAGLATLALVAAQAGLLASSIKLMAVNSTAFGSVVAGMSTLAKLGAIGLIIKGFTDFLSDDPILGLGQVLAGFAWFIPGPIGAIAGTIAVGLLLSQFEVAEGLSADNIAIVIGTALGISAAFRWNPALGVFTIGVALVFLGFKTGAFRQSADIIQGLLGTFTGGGREGRGFLANFTRSVGLVPQDDIVKIADKVNVMAGSFEEASFQLTGASLVPAMSDLNIELNTIFILLPEIVDSMVLFIGFTIEEGEAQEFLTEKIGATNVELKKQIDLLASLSLAKEKFGGTERDGQ